MPAPVPIKDQFTDAQKQEVVSLHNNGLTQAEIAERFSVLRRHSLQEIAEKLESSTSAVDRICTKHGIVLSKEAFRKSQSAKMIAAWTPEKRAECRERVMENLQTNPEMLDKLRKARKLWVK